MRKLLIVDDDPAVLAYVAKVAETLQFSVVQARDGLEALLEHADDPTVDALVTDVCMPGVNGFQLAQALRAKRPRLPVLFISGFFETTDCPPEWTQDEAAHFLPKPASPSSLASAFLLLFASETSEA